MLKNLSAYDQVQKFCKSHLKEDMKESSNPWVCLSNFTFDIKVTLIMIVMVGLPVLPGMAVGTIALIELLYLSLNITTYFRFKHYASCVLFIEQMLRAFLYLICVLYLFISYLKLRRVFWTLSKNSQETLILLLLIGRLAE